MWIGLVVVILATGQVVQDSASFGTEQECKDASAEILKAINEPKAGVMAYDIRCIRLDKLKKPGSNA